MMNIHLHPSYPPTPSICVMAAASKPEKAPDKAPVQYIPPMRTARSEGMYHVEHR